PARLSLQRIAGRPPVAGNAIATTTRRLAAGAEPSQARWRSAGRDRLGARPLSGVFEGVGEGAAARYIPHMAKPDFQPTLIGSTVMIRPMSSDDWPELFAAGSDPEIWKVHPRANRYTEPEFKTY